MPKKGESMNGLSAAQRNRLIRKNALREQLAPQGHLQHIIVLMDKLQDLNKEMDSQEIQRLSKVIDTKLKLIGKYLPDDKDPIDMNIGGQEDNPIETRNTWHIHPTTTTTTKDDK